METLFLSQARSFNISFELSIEWCYVARPNKFARRGASQATIQMLTLAFSIASDPEGPYQPYANRPSQGQWAGTRDHPYPETDMRRPIFTHPGERLSGSSNHDRPFPRPCLRIFLVSKAGLRRRREEVSMCRFV
jgi:hypothetical protein